ncbi:MAG: hypothetical protein Q6J33_00845 [Gloeomargarita sp. DG_2_bins_126]
MTLNTPIVFLIFRRPDLTQRVWERIRQVRPKTLLVVADGPRDEGEAEKCAQARSVIEQIDWPCDVYKNYAATNLGCKKRVSSGISWAFSLVEEAIILEDDCLPVPTFFTFCETLLNYYRQDERIFSISGNNFQDGKIRSPYSYYFSKYPHIWGWATWRRAWRYWHDHPDLWTEYKKLDLISAIHPHPLEQSHWQGIFEAMFYHQYPDTWDYLWTFACWSQGGFSIVPNVNMVSNLGFREDAAHTRNPDHQNANLAVADLEQITHPPFVVVDRCADEYTFRRGFGIKERPPWYRWRRRLAKLKDRISRMFIQDTN